MRPVLLSFQNWTKDARMKKYRGVSLTNIIANQIQEPIRRIIYHGQIGLSQSCEGNLTQGSQLIYCTSLIE
jgi:hypothetical protein